jgi:hypothetical protein
MPIPDVARPYAAPPLPVDEVTAARDWLAHHHNRLIAAGYQAGRRRGYLEALDDVGSRLDPREFYDGVEAMQLIAAALEELTAAAPRATTPPEASASGTESTLEAERPSLAVSDTGKAQDGTGDLSGPSWSDESDGIAERAATDAGLEPGMYTIGTDSTLAGPDGLTLLRAAPGPAPQQPDPVPYVDWNVDRIAAELDRLLAELAKRDIHPEIGTPMGDTVLVDTALTVIDELRHINGRAWAARDKVREEAERQQGEARTAHGRLAERRRIENESLVAQVEALEAEVAELRAEKLDINRQWCDKLATCVDGDLEPLVHLMISQLRAEIATATAQAEARLDRYVQRADEAEAAEQRLTDAIGELWRTQTRDRFPGGDS